MKINIANKNVFWMVYDSGRRHLYDLANANGYVTCEVFRLAKNEKYELREFRGWKSPIILFNIKGKGVCGDMICKFRTLTECLVYIKGKQFENDIIEII